MKAKFFLMLLGVTLALFVIIFVCVPDKPEPQTPALTTTAVSAITETTAISGGNITFDGNAAVTSCGACWSTSQNPTVADNKTTDEDETGNGSFTSHITGLTANTTYYVRAYATNDAGMAYASNQVSFTTLPVPNTVIDIDGNVYHTVVIGTQVWMAENLKTTKYRNGDQIPNVTDGNQWRNLSTGAYCNNNNEVNNANIYGHLYNWYAVSDGRNIALTGWHVPSDAEWTILTTFLGGETVAGDKLKESGARHWLSGSTGTNSSGFTALPGGYRGDDGPFSIVGDHGFWWSVTKAECSVCVWYRYLSYSTVFRSNSSRNAGYSVRCLRD